MSRSIDSPGKGGCHKVYSGQVRLYQIRFSLILLLNLEEHQTEEGEAKRRKEFQYVSAWEYKGEPKDAVLHKEELQYDDIEVKERSYK